MATKKKYYWLKLNDDFFSRPKIKKLRKIAGGDTYTIIYLKLQLLSLKDEGNLYFEGIEDTFIEELALTLDEDVDNVKVTILFLINQGLIEEVEKDEFRLIETHAAIGCESESTQRVRRHREKKKEAKLLQCNADEIKCNTEIEIEIDIEIDKKEINKEKKVFEKSKFEEENESVLFLFTKFKEICVSLPEPRDLTKKRKAALRGRLKEYDQKQILDVFHAVEASDFLTRRVQTNNSSWPGATFDWILTPANFIKILEGNYKNKDSPAIKPKINFNRYGNEQDLKELLKDGF